MPIYKWVNTLIITNWPDFFFFLTSASPIPACSSISLSLSGGPFYGHSFIKYWLFPPTGHFLMAFSCHARHPPPDFSTTPIIHPGFLSFLTSCFKRAIHFWATQQPPPCTPSLANCGTCSFYLSLGGDGVWVCGHKKKKSQLDLSSTCLSPLFLWKSPGCYVLTNTTYTVSEAQS